jgi:hypothetical protein
MWEPKGADTENNILWLDGNLKEAECHMLSEWALGV